MKWTTHEINAVRKLYCTTSYTVTDIAAIMGRTTGSVAAKITKHGMALERIYKR